MTTSHWFLALTEGPPERIVGAVRYAYALDGIDFRLVAGHGGELADREQELLDAFFHFCGRFSCDQLHYTDFVDANSSLDLLLDRAGFNITYREQRFETDWKETRDRVRRTYFRLEAKKGTIHQPKVQAIRRLDVEAALPLVVSQRLMEEAELRAMWNSPDPTILDRDTSACLMLNGETIGVILCADAGDRLRVLGVIGSENFAGARRRAIPMLMEHVFSTCDSRGYQGFIFRANVESAQQTANLALRLGGRVTGEVHRRSRIS